MARLLGGIAALTVAFCATFVFAEDEDFTTLNPARWETRAPGPGAGFQIGDGFLLAFNRIQFLNRSEWIGGEITFEVRPIKAVAADDGKTYGDQIVVFLASDGTFRKERSYEVLSGLVIRIDTVTGDVYIQASVDGITFENLAMLKGTGPMDPEKWHQVRIADLITTVTVSVNDSKLEFDGKDEKLAKLLATARKGKRWGFYGREAVGLGMRGSCYRKMSWW